MSYKNIYIEYTDYLGIKKRADLTSKQIETLANRMSRKEVIERLKKACKSYSKNYWVSGFINDKKVCHFQWAAL